MTDHHAILIQKLQQTKDITILKFALENQATFDFVPGQFAMIGCEKKKLPNGQIRKQAYSIASAPQEKKFIELCIKTKSLEGLSKCLCDLKINDKVVIDGPFGKFNFKKPKKENL